MALRLLGPLELVVQGRSLDLGGPRSRIVLAMLALNANRVTSVDQLIDAVWDDAPPVTARSQIQICISALRKLFQIAGQPDAIKTRSPGYVLAITEDELDSEQFGALVTTARAQVRDGATAAAAATLRAALDLWRGPALADIPSDLVHRGAVLLGERRLAAVAERMRLELELGRHREITEELQALIEEYPLREELYGFLVLALYRCGRQADALEVCRRARTVLVDEVGIEPGPELRELEHAVLNRDPAIDLPGSNERTEPIRRPQAVDAAPAVDQFLPPSHLPASIGDFTGREQQITSIIELLTEDRNATMSPFAVRIIAISGKGGVGKSSLAVRVAHQLRADFPDGHLYADLGADRGPGQTGKLLARFLRALGVSGSAIPDDTQERVELYRSKLANSRLLVVLDDVSGEEQIQPLLPGSPTCAVIATSRARLTGMFAARSVYLDVFNVDKSLELLSKIVGADRVDAERSASVELVRLCGGLPLALRIAGARLAAKPHWRISGLVTRLTNEARRLDELTHHGLELRSNIGLTYRSLPRPAQRLFRLFALIDAPDFAGWTAAALLDTDLAEADDLLEVLVDAQLVDTVDYPGTRRFRYRFHDLIRLYAREQVIDVETKADRDAALARVLGAWLALAEDAHRREYGGDYTILHGDAPRWRPREESTAELVGDPTDWWEGERTALVVAVRQAAAAGLAELCWDLALTSVTLFEAKGYFDDWLEITQVAHAATVRADNRRGQAAMLYSLGTLYVFQKRLPAATECLASALAIFEADGDTHGRALVVRNSALVDRLHGNWAVMLAKYAEALDAMRAVGDRIGEAHILSSLAKFRIDEGETDEAERLLGDALAICREVGCLRVEAQVLYRFAELHLGTNRIELSRQALNRVLLIVRGTGDPIGEAYALYGLGVVRHQEGRLGNAETTQQQALALATRVGERQLEGQALYALGAIALATQDRATAALRLIEAQRVFHELGSALWHAKALILLSQIDEESGDITMTRQHVAAATRLLTGVDSKESKRLLAQISGLTSALMVDETTGPGADTTLPGRS